MKTILQMIVFIFAGLAALVVVMALLALGRHLRTGLEESEYDNEDFL